MPSLNRTQEALLKRRLLAATRRRATLLHVKKKLISGVPIDQSRVIDGFGEVSGQTEYADEQVHCGLCGKKFVFTAAAKKYVFEVRRVPVKMRHRGAAYCDVCRDRRAAFNRLLRVMERLQREHRAAAAAVRAAPDDASAHAACARSIVRLVASSGKGPLNSAIHHARRARKLDPTCVESIYWEGRAHDLALRSRPARAMCEAYLADDTGRALPSRRADCAPNAYRVANEDYAVRASSSQRPAHCRDLPANVPCRHADTGK